MTGEKWTKLCKETTSLPENDVAGANIVNLNFSVVRRGGESVGVEL